MSYFLIFFIHKFDFHVINAAISACHNVYNIIIYIFLMFPFIPLRLLLIIYSKNQDHQSKSNYNVMIFFYPVLVLKLRLELHKLIFLVQVLAYLNIFLYLFI